MCSLCDASGAWKLDDGCAYDWQIESDTPIGEDTGSAADPLPWFTVAEVAHQLTTGYWQSTEGGGPRAFDIGPDGRLTVDVTALAPNGQDMARAALDAWSRVTGIDFVEIEVFAPASQVVAETGDAAGGTGTAMTMNAGEDFTGTLDFGADRDAVSVQLTAGVDYVVSLAGEGGSPLADPYLRVLDAAGLVVAQNDDADGRDSRLQFTPTAGGTYYLQAGSYADAYSGGYRMSLREGAQAADITFGDGDSGSYSYSTVFGGEILGSFVNVNQSWVGGESRIDGYHFQTYLHEIGHALGLGHAGNYNGAAAFGRDNHYANDSWSMSVMSYFHQTENPNTSSSFAYAITPMMADVAAIQSLYGTVQDNLGDTVYGRNATTGGPLDQAGAFANPVAYTVFDSGGTDHFDFSDSGADQRLDLRTGSFSDLRGLVENVAIMPGSVIETGATGAGNDRLTGNAVANALWSGDGDDLVAGGSGDDAIFGGAGSDVLEGGPGFDLLEGGAGGDVALGGDGGDLLVGDAVTLDLLLSLFPGWTAPPDAEDRVAAGDLHLLWADILADDFALA